jgi:hypothetical protein
MTDDIGFASIDNINDMFKSFDLDALISEAPNEMMTKTIRPLFLATMRPSRKKNVDVGDANFGVIQEEMLFNDDPTIQFADGEQVLALDEDTGVRRRATVIRDMGLGCFEVEFKHNNLKQVRQMWSIDCVSVPLFAYLHLF